MADDLSIVLGVKLNEADLSSIESKLNSVVKGKKGEGDKVKINLDKTINTQLANLKKSLDSITKPAKPYKIDIQINQQITKEIKSLTDDLNKAAANLQKYQVSANKEALSNLAKNTKTGNIKDSGLPHLGVSTLVKVDGEDVKQIQKFNDALGETRTIIHEIENGEITSTTEKFTTNYEEQTKALEKANKERQKLEDDYTKLHIQARQKQAKEDERVAREESKRQEDYTKLFVQARQKQAKEELAEATRQQKEIEKTSKEREDKEKMYAGLFTQRDKEDQRAMERTKKFVSDQNNEIAKLESKAFNQDNPLSGKFEEPAKAAIQAWKDAVNQIDVETDKLAKSQETAIKDLQTKASLVVTEQKKAQYQGQKLTANSFESDKVIAGNQLQTQITKLQEAGLYTDELKTKFDNLSNSLQGVNDQNGLKAWNEELKMATSEADALEAKMKLARQAANLEINKHNIQTDLENVKKKYQEIIELNPDKKSTNIEEHFEKVQQAINNMNPQTISLVRAEMTGLRREVSGLQPQVTSFAQALQQGFGSIGQYISRFVSATYLLSKGIKTIKSMVNEVKAVDSSLVELQKVTDLTGSSLDQFVEKAYNVGKGLGRTGKDVIDATTTFSRAGYDLQEATKLAQSALVMTNVGVDIPNMESAASDMISILKAFDVQAEDSMEVIDKLYNVSNKQPLDFGNLTQMLVTAGGTLAQTGTTLDETMGLLTGAFATMRDTSVANGLIMISQRLRGVNEEGEALEKDFVPKLKSVFGDIGVSIEDQNGELKSTYEILDGLASKWDTLSSKQKQYIGEKAAGNRQVKTLNAIMQNWDVVKSSIEDASEAAGTAAEGNELYMDSIEGRITQLQSAFQALATQTINSDLVGWIVSVATSVLNLTTEIGGLTPVLTTIVGLIATIKGEKIASGLSKLKDYFKGAATEAGTLANSLSTIPGKIGLILTIASVFISIANAVEGAKKSLEDYEKEASDLGNDYKDQANKLEDLNSKLKDTQKLINTLNGKESLTVVEQDELERLQSENDLLERQIKLQEILTGIAEEKARKAAVEADEQKRATTSEGKKKLLGGFITVEEGPYNIPGEAVRAGGTTLEEYLAYYRKELPKQKQAVIDATKDVQSLNKDLLDQFGEHGTLEAMETSRMQAEEEYNKQREIIAERIAYLQGLVGDLKRVENPITESDIKFNQMVDELEGLNNILLLTDNVGADVTTQAKYIATTFKDAIKQIQETIEETGEINIDDIFKNFPEMEETFKAFGWTKENVAKYYKEMYSSAGSAIQPEMNFSVEAVGGSLFSTSDSKTTKDLTAVQESYKNLMAAMAEQQKAGYLTYETWSKLIGDKGLAGIENELQLTANGYMINTDSIYKYIDAMNESVRIDMVAAITERENAIKKLQESMEDLTDEEEKAASQAKIDIWTNEIEQFKALANEASAATSALEKYRNAANSVNEDAEHTEGASLFSDLKDIYKSGKVGTDDFKSGMDFLLGEGWLKRYEGDVDKAWQAAKKIGDKYFGEDDLKSANAFEKELIDKGFAQYDKDTGALSMLTKEGDIPYTLGEIAEGLGITEDAAQSLFGLLNTYYADGGFEIGNIITSEEDIKLAEKRLEELNTTLETEQKKLEEMSPEDDGYVEQQKQVEKLTQDVSNLTTSVETAKEAVESVGDGESLTDAMSIDEAIAKIAEYQSAIETLMSQGLRVPVELTNQYTDLENLMTTDTLDGPEMSITVTDADDAKEKIATIRSALKYINENKNISPVVKATVNENGDTTIAALEQFIQKYEDGKWGEGEKTIAISSNGTMTVTIDQNTLDSEITTSDKKIDEFVNKDRTMQIGVKLPEPNELSFETAYETVLKKIYQEALLSTKDELGQLMERWFGSGGDVDLSNRPVIKASKLADVGWEVENPDEIATLFSTHDFIGENGEIAVVLTPILPDGDVLSPETIDTVFENLFVGSDGQLQLPEGDWGFNLSDIVVSSFDVSNISPEDRNAALKAFGSYLSKLQDLYYNTQWDSNGKAPQMTAEEFFNLGDDALLKAQFDVEPKEGAGENLVSQVQDQVDGDNPVQVPVEEEKSNTNPTDKWNYGTDWVWEGEEFDETNVQVGATVTVDEDSVEETVEEIEEAVQNAKVDIPVDMTDSLGEGVKTLTQLATAAGTDQQQIDNLYNSYEALVEAVKQYNSTDQSDSDALQEAATNLQSASSAFSEAYTNLKSEADSLGVLYDTSAADQQLEQLKTLASQAVNVPIEADTSSASKSISSLGNSISIKRNMPVGADVSSARQTYTTFKEEIENTEVTMHVNMEKSNTPKLAKGTKRSKDQLALVDDGNGAELIEHKKQGTFELGTNDGPRLVELDEGDVVHTAEETKKILSRFGKIGNLFASGTKKKKKDTKNATKVTVDVVENREPTGVDGSSKSVTGTGKSTTTTKKKSSSKKKSGSSSSKKKSSESFSDYASKLYDWIEVKLDRLQEKTDRWIQKASEVTKVADKNKYLDKALKSVGEQIDANTKGQKKYLKQAAEVAKKGGLSDDMIKKIQEGSIEIGSYSSEMQTVIEEYKEWYDKAVECGDALSELKEQQTELATMKLDNIIDSYTNRVDYRSGKLDIEEQRRSYLTTAGKGEKGAKSSGSVAKELKASYKKSLETIQGKGSTKGTLYYLEQERKELEKSLNDSVSKGYIEKYSDEWYEYQQKIQDVSKEIIDYETQIVELKDAIAEVDLTQMGYKLDKETRASAAEQRKIDLNQAKGGSRMKDMDSAKEIQKNLLDSNKLLEEQNAYYRDLQKNLDPLSDKYQEYEEAIEANNEAINQNKIEYINWQDTINDLDVQNVKDKISEIDAAISRLTDNISIATQKGQRITADMYTSLIDQENAKVRRNQTLINDLRDRQNSIIKQGGSKNSDKWQELQREIEGLEAENRSSVLTIEEWKDAIEELPLTELGWSLDSITDKATKTNEALNEDIATGKKLETNNDSYYNQLINNNNDQMKIYEEENKLLRQQQADILKNGGSIQSQEYQELEGRIRANESAMSGLRVSTAEYNDEVRKLKIQELTWDLNELKEAQDKLNQSIEYNKAAGIEQTATEYNGLVASTQENIANLQNQNAILEAAQQKILAEGGSEQSQKYQELEEQIRSNNDAIDDSTLSIIGWKKEIYNLKVQKYIWQYDALERSISNLNHTINMNKSTGVAQTKDAYEMMSKITKSQIKDLQDQNSVLLTEQKGMDKYSDAYQEIQSKVRENLNSIEGLTEKLVEYQDAINQITIDNFTWQLDALTTSVDRINKGIDLNSAKGVEQTAQAYRDLIKNAEDQIKVQEKLIAEYRREQQGMDVNSEKYQELEKNIRDCESSITDLTLSTIEYTDSINKLPIQKLSWALEAINRVANSINDSMNLHEAQGLEETADTYEKLVKNGMQQIENLEQQNRLLKLQQVGLDENSEKWQEIQSQIDSNNSSINQLKVSQEQWNDAVIDLKISQLEKYKDQLSKANDQYQRQKELQEAIEELQKAQAQRTVRTYREGVGFVWEADQDQLKSAQEKLEDVIENQLLNKIDDLVEALEDYKNDTNVYDAQGNLLGTRYSTPNLESLGEILQSYYKKNELFPDMDNITSTFTQQLVEQVKGTGNTTTISFGDINLSDVNDINSFAAAIVSQLPNAILQLLNKQ